MSLSKGAAGRVGKRQGARLVVRNPALLAAVIIFAVALATRLLWITVPINIDEAQWIQRGPAFFIALLSGHLKETFLRHHPGVTNMWLIGGGLSLRYLLRDLLSSGGAALQGANLRAYLEGLATGANVSLDAYVSARLSLALVTAGSLVGIYLLSRRLFGEVVALIAAVVLLFEPFFVAYQRSITTDANQANFIWLALLAFLLYMRGVMGSTGNDTAWASKARGWLVLSGVFYGMAVLSKVTALLTLPVFGLAGVWLAWSQPPVLPAGPARGTRARVAHGPGSHTGRGTGGRWLRVALDLVLWGIVTAATIFLAWPALWADLPGTLGRLIAGLGGEVAGHDQFLLGRYTRAPGIAFYPLVLVARLSPLLLIGSVLGLVALAVPPLRRRLPYRTGLMFVLLMVVVLLIGMSCFASKHDRYIIPLVPGLALLTAAGLWAAVSLWRETVELPRISLEATANGEQQTANGKQPRAPRDRQVGRPPFWTDRLVAFTILGVILVQLAVMLPHLPYYLTYFSPLVGGPAGAQKLLMVGNGEVLDQAAAWLNEHAEADSLVAGRDYTASLRPYFRGRIVELFRDPLTNYWPLTDANYVVLYSNQFQRHFPTDLLDYFAPQKPLHTVRAYGVDYARIYRGPAVRPADVANLTHPLDLDFGGQAHLLGYDLETPEVAAGEKALLALYWQATQPLAARDYTVYVGLRDKDGNQYGLANRVPVGGLLPVDQWRQGQVVRDVQEVTVLPGTPPGEYTLEVGFYSPQLGQALEIRDRDGPRGNQVVLAKVRVARPQAALEPGSDLEIANRLEGVELAPGGPRLLGYEWPQPEVVRAGDGLAITLLWQAGAETPGDVQLYLQLRDSERQWRRAVGHPLGGAYPPQSWARGELVRDVFTAFLPADVPAGEYELELVASTEKGDKALANLGHIEISTRPHNFAAAEPLFPQQAELGKTARLEGYDIATTGRAGEPLPVTLYWRAIGEAARNYVRFVHMLDAGDRIVAQHDSIPGEGTLPLTSWVPGELLADQVQLPLPPNLPPGRYRLAVGLYDPANGQRLPIMAEPHGPEAALDGRDTILFTQAVEVR